MFALLHSHDGRVKGRKGFVSVERGHMFAPVADEIHPSGVGKA